MGTDEQRDGARKIGTEGGDYAEGGPQQRVTVHVGERDAHDTAHTHKLSRILADIAELKRNGGFNAASLLELRRKYPEYEHDIDAVVQGELAHTVERLSNCMNQMRRFLRRMTWLIIIFIIFVSLAITGLYWHIATSGSGF